MAAKDNNPFKALDKSRFPKDAADKEARAKRRQLQEQANKLPPSTGDDTASDEDLFAQAMGGVEPVKGQGRRVAARPVAPAAPSGQDLEDEALEHLQDLVSGKVQFSLEFTDEYIQGHVKGLDTKTVAQLKAGRFSPETHLDLHGLNSQQAYDSMLCFVREQYQQSRRCVLIIPGRGKNSPEGYGVLRERVQTWLTRDPFKRVVLAFTTALPKHGGAGALYVLLRRYKKTGAKIIWDRHCDGNFDDL